MIINTNMSALAAYRNLGRVDSQLTRSLERLSSGLRINRAADDAAGMAISEKMTGQVRGLQQAQRNAQDGVSLIQTAEGALAEIHAILQRMRELAVQAANDTLTGADRTTIQGEVTQLRDEITRIASTTEFNTMILLAGAFSGVAAAARFHVGANQGQIITLNIRDMRASALTGVPAVTVASQTGANTGIGILTRAIDTVSTERSRLGATQNRLEHTIANLTVGAENLIAARSRIQDLDMAREMMAFTRNQILSQAGTAMLAQANLRPQTVLQLLR
ncbi:MAG: Flagellin [Syntrophomonadaceae bacterium]|nr:Flagellin [Bacillota bacterium]